MNFANPCNKRFTSYTGFRQNRLPMRPLRIGFCVARSISRRWQMPEESKLLMDIPELRSPFVFRRRPVSIPADLRPAWRIGLILLLLKKCCRQGKTSLTRLHVLSWGFISREGQSQLTAAATGRLAPDSLVIRFEPFLLQAV